VTRRLARAAVVAFSAVVTLPLLAVAASAAPLDDLPGHAGTFTVVDGILVFGVAPVSVYLLIALIVMRPGTASKAQRYRPGRDWTAAPSWSGLHPESTRALPPATDAVPVLDGAPDAVHADSTDTSDAPEPAPGRGEPHETGGARGSW
jgi:hypothetical protein